MPETFYVESGDRKGEMFVRCCHCGWHLPEAYRDMVASHEEDSIVSGTDFNGVVMAQADGPDGKYLVLLRNGANRQHERTYDLGAFMNKDIPPYGKDILKKVATLPSSAIDGEIHTSKMRALTPEELKWLNYMVFESDYSGERSQRLGVKAFRTLQC
jgi:hypothetical protein